MNDTTISQPALPVPKTEAHKGDFGYVVIAGGNQGMLGAILLAGKAALRCGSGRVRLLSTTEHIEQIALSQPELMSCAFTSSTVDKSLDAIVKLCDVIAIGPGLDQTHWSRSVLDYVLQQNKPIVIDADALNLLATMSANQRELLPQQDWVLSPHVGEAARLLNCDVDIIQADRRSAAIKISQRYNAFCVLKGHHTLVADKLGNVSVCKDGNTGMATAGMGDVLTGMIAAFIGQKLALRTAIEAAVWLHANSADLLVKNQAKRSLIASDIINYLPELLLKIEADTQASIPT